METLVKITIFFPRYMENIELIDFGGLYLDTVFLPFSWNQNFPQIDRLIHYSLTIHVQSICPTEDKILQMYDYLKEGKVGSKEIKFAISKVLSNLLTISLFCDQNIDVWEWKEWHIL